MWKNATLTFTFLYYFRLSIPSLNHSVYHTPITLIFFHYVCSYMISVNTLDICDSEFKRVKLALLSGWMMRDGGITVSFQPLWIFMFRVIVQYSNSTLQQFKWYFILYWQPSKHILSHWKGTFSIQKKIAWLAFSNNVQSRKIASTKTPEVTDKSN